MNAFKESMLGWVLYPSTPQKRMRMERWAKSTGVTKQSIVNNHKPSLAKDEQLGSNAAYEFSAYLQLIDSFEGNGPFVLVNDTLFKNHWRWAWGILVKKAAANISGEVICGDIRLENGDIDERPNVFLASWIFIIPNRSQLTLFKQVLSKVLEEPCSTPSPAYNNYLEAWLQPSRWYKGWHGLVDANAVARKRASIQWEHALSKKLMESGVHLQSIGQHSALLYMLTRAHDRFVTRLQALSARFFRNTRM